MHIKPSRISSIILIGILSLCNLFSQVAPPPPTAAPTRAATQTATATAAPTASREAAAAATAPTPAASGAQPHPAGATAICKDETYSYSISRRGSCSWHGGVKTWLVDPR